MQRAGPLLMPLRPVMQVELNSALFCGIILAVRMRIHRGLTVVWAIRSARPRLAPVWNVLPPIIVLRVENRFAMQCPSCGTVNKSDARYCMSCGAVLESEPGMLQAGQLVGGGTYRVIRPLGKGGMGAVYLAANTKAFDRPCVVKEIIEYYDPADPEARRKAVERFEAEARTLAALKHSGIPDIYAYFTEGGRNYLVMEYIEGPNLAQGLTRDRDGRTVKGSPQPVEDVVRYVIQICEVLSYLEQQQPPVIHNDIKPANIILDKNTGRAVLVDFGTARTRYAPLPAGQPPGRPGGQQSSVYGTIGYAAPELYEGKAEPRSDVYALAATAYHLLTNDDPRAHPFKFDKMADIPEPPRQALADALKLDVSVRLSAAQLSARLDGAFDSLDARARSSPKLKVITERLVHDPDRQEPSEIVIANVGGGDLDGVATSSEPWIKVARQFKCAPGQTQSLLLTIEVKDLEPGKTYRGVVHVKAVGAQSTSVPIEVRVPPPLLDIAPMQIDLGAVSRGQLFTKRAAFKVRNIGKSRAVCQVQADTPWLVLNPKRFTCMPGQTQMVELVGRGDLLPSQGDSHETTLHLDVEGGYPRQVQVSLDIRRTGRRIASFVMIGSAALVLLGAIAWFFVTVLPLLVP
jgi:serine/threonine protein kinase